MGGALFASPVIVPPHPRGRAEAAPVGGGAGVEVPPASGVAGVEHLAVPAASFWARGQDLDVGIGSSSPDTPRGQKSNRFRSLFGNFWMWFYNSYLRLRHAGRPLNDHEGYTYEVYAVTNVPHLVIEYESQRMCGQGLRPIVDRTEGGQSRRSYDFIEPNDRQV